jgi:hypothetical protein
LDWIPERLGVVVKLFFFAEFYFLFAAAVELEAPFDIIRQLSAVFFLAIQVFVVVAFERETS